MYNQSFSGIELYKLTTQVERRDFSSGKEELCRAIEEKVATAISNRSYTFDIKNIDGLFINAHPSKTPDEKLSRLCQDLVLRKIYQNIKKYIILNKQIGMR